MTSSSNIISASISRLIKNPLRSSIRLLWQRNHQDWLVILAYHRVADQYDPQIHLPKGWNQTAKFEQQIRFLKDKYKVVPLHDALQQLDTGTLRGPCIAITIDDGDSSVKTHIAPILEKHNCPATIFITSAYLQCEQLHFPFVVRYLANSPDAKDRKHITQQHQESLNRLLITSDVDEYNDKRKQIEKLSDYIPDKQRFFLSIDDLKALDPSIFNIGLHGHEHQRFAMMDAEWQNQAIEKNINALRDLEHYRPLFAVPFGSSRDWNMDTAKICLQHELFFLTCSGGVNLHKSVDYRRIFSDAREVGPIISQALTGIA